MGGNREKGRNQERPLQTGRVVGYETHIKTEILTIVVMIVSTLTNHSPRSQGSPKTDRKKVL